LNAVNYTNMHALHLIAVIKQIWRGMKESLGEDDNGGKE